MSKSPITCHVLDSSLGKPASGVTVSIHKYDSNQTSVLTATGETNADGRCTTLLDPTHVLEAGSRYKLVFEPRAYFEKTGRKCFYPLVEITFEVEDPKEHYHIPLLISPYSYTTYRGS